MIALHGQINNLKPKFEITIEMKMLIMKVFLLDKLEPEPEPDFFGSGSSKKLRLQLRNTGWRG